MRSVYDNRISLSPFDYFKIIYLKFFRFSGRVEIYSKIAIQTRIDNILKL